MKNEFYGATSAAEAFVNKLLRLPATGSEQDWEFELADPSRIGEMVALLKSNEVDLDVDQRSAVALLLISSIGEARHSDLMSEAASAIALDKDVLARMKFYWVFLKKMDDEALAKKLGLSD